MKYAPVLVCLAACTFPLIMTGCGGDSSGPSNNTAALSTRPAIPPGFSSKTIHVKFQEGTNVDSPLDMLPPDLRSGVATYAKLFALPKQKLNELRARGRSHSGKTLPDLNLWIQLTLQSGTDAASFLEALKHVPSVEIAEPAPLPQPLPATTPDFTGNQGYLDVAPGGIDARFAFTIPGGNGSGVKIYDIEYSWHQTHEDLSKAHGISLLLAPGDSAFDFFHNDNHGTAVLGEMIADNNSKGVTGISWGANIGLAPAETSNLGYNPANAILLAVANGSAGDVILIEQQQPVCGLGSTSYGPPEVIPAVFQAIQTAVAQGIVVIETAGNGSVNLDLAVCNGLFDRTLRDSGAIIVGAGFPPSSGVDRQRKPDSTFGSRVDLQGWGTGVLTTGYGDLYTNPDAPTNPDFWYTAVFAGTSSAAPIVAGAAANLQGIALAQSATPLTPLQLRTVLVQTGSPQLGNTAEHIGPRPDLRQAFAQIAHVPNDVAIDIYPGTFPNSLNPRAKGVIPVAILTTDIFNASNLDSATVRFGASGTEAPPVQSALADVDGDGRIDMILHFQLQATAIQCGRTTAFLTGQTFDGGAIEASDSIVTVGCLKGK
jgi:serine protease